MSGGRPLVISLSLNLALLGLVSLGVTLLGGCAPRRVEIGAVIDPARVAALHPGQTTRDEVEHLLGAPAGRGRVMLPFQDQPHQAWTYQFARARRAGDGRLHARHGTLLVFFAGETVAGYLWLDTAGE